MVGVQPLLHGLRRVIRTLGHLSTTAVTHAFLSRGIVLQMIGRPTGQTSPASSQAYHEVLIWNLKSHDGINPPPNSLGPCHEKFGLSARARYTWRDAYRSTDFGSTSSFPWGFPVVQAARGQLNASVSYDVNDRLTLGVEGVNLTESEVKQYCVNDGALLCFEGLTDRRITFGATYNFYTSRAKIRRQAPNPTSRQTCSCGEG